MITLGYVVSHAYSGSTLLSFLLGAHPDVATVGEMTGVVERLDPETYPCSCGRLLKDCDFWISMASAMKRRGEAFDVRSFRMRFRVPDHRISDLLIRSRVRSGPEEMIRSAALTLLPGPRRHLRALLARNLAFVESVCEVDGGAVFLDISKRPGRAAMLRRIPELDVRVIHLVRDARGVMWSSMKNMGIGAADAARSWRRELTETELLRGRFAPERWLSMRYEDLCRAPDAELDRAFRFLGVDPSRAARDVAAVQQHIIGNDMRLSKLSEIRMDEAWRSKLGPEDLAAYGRIAEADNLRLGYDGGSADLRSGPV